MSTRVEQLFTQLKTENRKAFVSFITAGDPNKETSQAIINALPDAGVDIIELGMPFSDPVADGPAIQLANLRSLKAGATLKHILALVENFRKGNQTTPIILMGYYNPIYQYGIEAFAQDAKKVGIDGVIIVDLPPEEDQPLFDLCVKSDIHWIRLITPTSDEARLKLLLKKANGFVYYVAVAGITGTTSADNSSLKQRVDFIKQHTDLPVAVGFGIKTNDQVKEISAYADAVVVGSAIVSTIGDLADKPTQEIVAAVVKQVQQLTKK